MKKLNFYCAIIFAMYTIIPVTAQINLVANGDFEATNVWTSWNTTLSNGDLWGGAASGSGCSARSGSKYIWFGDQSQSVGVDEGVENTYQTLTIPSTATACNLYFLASINTEETGSTAYDFMRIRIRSSTGALLHDWGSISNVNGSFGIPGCQNWVSYFANTSLPSTLFGQVLRLSFEFSSDVSEPTIFRLDSVALVYTSGSNCTYSLTNPNYNCPSSSANNYTNISAVTTQTGCAWTASVTTGNSWLSTMSSGTGTGNISISVTANTGQTPRVGTITAGGQIFTILQPGSCTYSLSLETYLCASAAANNYNNISNVTTQAGCPWNATVMTGGSWLSTSSSGSGNGSLSISVQANTQSISRVGTIRIGTQSITVTQPGTCIYSLSTAAYTLANASTNTYPNIATVYTQAGCSWTAFVTSGSSWLGTLSTGNGDGTISITAAANTSSMERFGTINVNGQTLSITQPGACLYTLSTKTYTCTNAMANNYGNISNVSTTALCPWSANVTSGSAWLSSTSGATGNGSISISVTQNTGTSSRTATIDVKGDSLKVTQPGSLVNGINELSKIKQFSISPNPVSTILTIEVINKDITLFSVYDITGRKVIDQEFENQIITRLNVSELQSGIYLLKTNLDGANSGLRFVKE